MGIKKIRRDLTAWMEWAREHLATKLGRPCTEDELTRFFADECLRLNAKTGGITSVERTDIKWS